ncbi:hypothetical protein JD844_004858 [Phrynosoma platyrhinos]|uniref:Major facilitator superfamily (MFS) profile domain-containing protein n=1 Tax=Phrynosoma platyrhinos TaxID=52577 RepID=A0ABQ7SDU9_PHRPL|nr:hypothetical protein JD844_004858 [Phrynosoma platyrhinos]
MASEESRPLLGTAGLETQLPADERSLQLENYLSKVQNRNLYLATFAAVLGPLSFGFVLGYSSPAIPSLKRGSDPELRLEDSQASWFGSVVTLGAAAGGILGGYIVDKVGRKLSLMLCAIPYVFGFTIIISAQNIWMLYTGRILSGLASGVTSLVVPEELSLAEFKNPAIYKPFFIGVTMMFFQQVSGINAIMFYAETIFEEANFKNSGAASVIVGSIQVFFTAVAALIIDRTGRKVLLVVSGFALGWGPIPWLVMSEIFPLRARGIASGACVLTNWLMAFLITKEFHDFMVVLTPYGTFWLFSATCLLNVFFTILCVPETRGKSLEEIEAYFRRSH